MIDFKEETILFIVQVLFLIVFAFILKDVVAALVVSFFSRPLTKMVLKWIDKNLAKRNKETNN